MSEPSHILNSWKEIASYMQLGIRTVQSYHATHQLPVYRFASGHKRSPVFAYREELDRWLRNRSRSDDVVAGGAAAGQTREQKRKRASPLSERAKQLRLQAIQAQLDSAFTCCSTAEKALRFGQVEKGRKAVASARHAAQRARKHIAEPHHVPEKFLPSLQNRLTKLDAQISSIEATLS